MHRGVNRTGRMPRAQRRGTRMSSTVARVPRNSSGPEFLVDLNLATRTPNYPAFQDVQIAGFRFDQLTPEVRGLFHVIRSCPNLKKLYIHFDHSYFRNDLEGDSRDEGAAQRLADGTEVPRAWFPRSLKEIFGVCLQDTRDELEGFGFGIEIASREPEMMRAASLAIREGASPAAFHDVFTRAMEGWFRAIKPETFLTKEEREEMGFPPLHPRNQTIPRDAPVCVYIYVPRPILNLARVGPTHRARNEIAWQTTIERDFLIGDRLIEVRLDVLAFEFYPLERHHAPQENMDVTFDEFDEDASPMDTFYYPQGVPRNA